MLIFNSVPLDKMYKAIYRVLPVFPIGFLLLSLMAYLIRFGYIAGNDYLNPNGPHLVPIWFINDLFSASWISMVFILPSVIVLHYILINLTKVLEPPMPWKLIAICGSIYILAFLLTFTEAFGWYLSFMIFD